MLSSRSILFLFSLLLLSALNDLTGPSAGPVARTTYSYSYSKVLVGQGVTNFLNLFLFFLTDCIREVRTTLTVFRALPLLFSGLTKSATGTARELNLLSVIFN